MIRRYATRTRTGAISAGVALTVEKTTPLGADMLCLQVLARREKLVAAANIFVALRDIGNAALRAPVGLAALARTYWLALLRVKNGRKTMRKKIETTQRGAATAASHVLSEADKRIASCRMVISSMEAQIIFIENSKKAAGSALTQVEDE